MKKYSLPVQLFKLLVSLVLSWFIVSLVFSSIFVEEVPQYVTSIEIIVAIVFALIVVIIYDYNEICSERSLVQKTRQDVKSAIEVRKKLIDKAEKVIDKYSEKETELYKKFAEARGNTSSTEASLKAISEAYPNLKANEGIQKLLNQLDNVEKLILDSKRQYTFCVAQYNASIHSFPVVIVKPIFKWQEINSEVMFEEEIVSDEELGI